MKVMSTIKQARTDSKSKAIVEKAIELENLVGAQVAAGFLASRKIPFEVAKRVLTEPAKRRKDTVR